MMSQLCRELIINELDAAGSKKKTLLFCLQLLIISLFLLFSRRCHCRTCERRSGSARRSRCPSSEWWRTWAASFVHHARLLQADHWPIESVSITSLTLSENRNKDIQLIKHWSLMLVEAAKHCQARTRIRILAWCAADAPAIVLVCDATARPFFIEWSIKSAHRHSQTFLAKLSENTCPKGLDQTSMHRPPSSVSTVTYRWI